jgi:hypothetical protein
VDLLTAAGCRGVAHLLADHANSGRRARSVGLFQDSAGLATACLAASLPRFGISGRVSATAPSCQVPVGESSTDPVGGLDRARGRLDTWRQAPGGNLVIVCSYDERKGNQARRTFHRSERSFCLEAPVCIGARLRCPDVRAEAA